VKYSYSKKILNGVKRRSEDALASNGVNNNKKKKKAPNEYHPLISRPEII